MVDFVRFCFMGTPMTDYEKTAVSKGTAVGRRALRHSDAVFLYHQPYPPIRLDKGFRMRQYHRPNLLL